MHIPLHLRSRKDGEKNPLGSLWQVANKYLKNTIFALILSGVAFLGYAVAFVAMR
jgi:hypothetical protein